MATDSPEEFLSLVRSVEESGFDTLWVTDSSLHGHNVYSYLTLAARETDRIRLGTNCTHPLGCHPAITANAIVTLNELSEGRAILGLGAGGGPTYELGYERAASLRQVEETVQLTRRLLRGSIVDSDGEFIRCNSARILYGLNGHSPPPIYLTSSGPRMLSLAGRVADGVLMHCSAHEAGVDFALAQVHQGAAEAGRIPSDLDIAWHLWGALDETVDAALDAARPAAANMARSAPRYCDLAGVPDDLVAKIQQAYDARHFTEAEAAHRLVTDDMVTKLAVAGPAKTWLQKFELGLSKGISHFEIFPLGDRHRLIRELGEHLPGLRRGE